MKNNKTIVILLSAFIIIVILFAVTLFLFQTAIRPNHYQYLFPYTQILGRNLVTTESRVGKDGGLEVLIPYGTAVLGVDDRMIIATLEPFWIDQRLITVRQYLRCVNEGRCSRPCYRNEYSDFSSSFWKLEMPIVFVESIQAQDYCEFQGHLPAWGRSGKKLRAEAGWTHLSLGRDEHVTGLRYARHEFYSGILETGWLPKSANEYGVMDMFGNVREWVFDAIREYEAVQLLPWGVRTGLRRWREMMESRGFSDDLAHIPLLAHSP